MVKPNVGKSSFINALVGSERLMVSSLAGTTRDYIEIPLPLKSGVVSLIDTAGLGNAVDELDQMAMKKTKEILKQAHYKVLLVEKEEDLTQTFIVPDIVIQTKSDTPSFVPISNSLAVSSLEKKGIESFLAYLDQVIFKEKATKELFINSQRQYLCLKQALKIVQSIKVMCQTRPQVEILTFEFREVKNKLEELIGKHQPQEVLKQIFSGFCIGK